MASSEPLLKLINVCRRYGSPDGAGSLSVLDGVSLEVQRGESLAIVGPSGSGKSTLLHLIGTLDRPSSGEVLLDGQDLSRLDDTQLAAVRNRQIGFIFQAHFLLPQCTVLENVLVPTLAMEPGEAGTSAHERRAPDDGIASSPRPSPPKEEREQTPESAPARAERLLTRVGLAERLNHRPGQLSGGERQRVAVVRALINQPQLLLADEPTGALDHASAQQLGQLLVDLNREEGVTLIVVTHSRELAQEMGRVLELKDGHLAPCGAGG